MRVAYVAPRFHTNQIPVVKGWLETGNEVLFISQYTGKSEDYSVCEPTVLGYSNLFHVIDKLYRIINKNKIAHSSNPENFKMHYGFPPVFKLAGVLKTFQPDVAILRERSIYNIFVYAVCKIKKIPCILYNQTPLYDYEAPKTDILHRIVRSLTPSKRMTPVMGNPSTGYLDADAVYIPFVMEPQVSPQEKQHFADGKIHVLCVAKFETRKNILMLIDVVKQLKEKYDLHLTVAGEVSTGHHKEYYQKVQEYIEQEKLEEVVSLVTNISRDEVFDLYKQTDLFVLPSTGEFASVSQLEAMACSLPVICSDTNGTRCYVEPDVNGQWFKDKNADDLLFKLEMMIRDKQKLLFMGEESYRLVCEKYQFDQYKERILNILNEGHK